MSEPTIATSRWALWAAVIYLPLTVVSIFWLAWVPLASTAGSWAYDIFHGPSGSLALLWLLLTLLPAITVLSLRSHGLRLASRLSGALGFYTLLGALLSDFGQLGYLGFTLLITSIVLRKRYQATGNR